MITPKVNFKNLVCGLLPWQKRLPNRLVLLRAFVAPLVALFGDFDQWRADTRMVARVTSQVKVLEGYLRKKYNQPVAIKIVTYEDGAINVGLEVEGQRLLLGTVEESAPTVDLPLSGERREQFGDTQFIIFVPAAVDIDELRADIERFRTAGTTYAIMAGHYIVDNERRRFVSEDGSNLVITVKI